MKTLHKIFSITFLSLILSHAAPLLRPASLPVAAPAPSALNGEDQKLLSTVVPAKKLDVLEIDPDALIQCREGGCSDLTLEAPDGETFFAKRQRETGHTGTKGWSWFGFFDQDPFQTLFIYEQDGYLNGKMQKNGKLYVLEARAKGRVLLIEVDQQEFSSEEAHHDHSVTHFAPPPAPASPPPVFPPPPPRKTLVNVMVIYSSNYSASFGSPEARDAEIATRIAESNTVYANSGINLEIRLIHSQQVNLSNSLSRGADVATLEINALRFQHKADLVSFWNTGGSAGSAHYFWGETGNLANAYSQVEKSSIMTNYTFTHELGHNMGADHDRTAFSQSSLGTQLDLYSYYSYGICFPGYRSVMAYTNCEKAGGSNDNCPRVPYFSNPDVMVNGLPFGVEGTHRTLDLNGPANNAKRINEKAPYVAAYYDNGDDGMVPDGEGGVSSSSETEISSSSSEEIDDPSSSEAGNSSSSEDVNGIGLQGEKQNFGPLKADAQGVRFILTTKETATLRLTTITGHQLFERTVSGEGEAQEISWGRALNKGIYFATLKSPWGAQQSIRFVVR